LKRFAEQFHARIDLAQIKVGQRLVDQPVALEAIGQPRKLNVLFEIDANMVGFSVVVRHDCSRLRIGDLRNFRPTAVL